MKVTFAILISVLLLAAYWMNMNRITPAEQKTYQRSALAEAGNACELISEKAVLQLPEGLEFQRLEKAGRKARVLQICMRDHGYQENSAWVQFAKRKVEQTPKSNSVSQDEAYEIMRRKHMLIYQAEKNQPLYWVSSKPT